MSKRKPYNDTCGYIASRRNLINNGWVVIYLAKEQGIDVGENKYAIVCEKTLYYLWNIKYSEGKTIFENTGIL